MHATVGMPSPIVITARHFANRAPSSRYSSSRLAEAVEALGDLLAGEAGLVVRAGVHLDPGDDALRREQLGERRAVVRRLANRLVVQDHAADGVLHARVP